MASEPEMPDSCKAREDGYSASDTDRAQIVVDTGMFTFPLPAPLKGVKSRAREVLKMNNVGHKLPRSSKLDIADVSLTLSQASRVALIGAKGIEKPLFLKVLMGQLKPTEGTHMMAESLYIAHVAKSSLKGLECASSQTPAEYILSRFHRSVGDTAKPEEEDHATARPFTLEGVLQHLFDLGLDRMSASQMHIRDMSTAARAKLILAEVMWRRPQILIFDEFDDCFEQQEIPALIAAISKYRGGVVVMSTNVMFFDAVATEKWLMCDGFLSVDLVPSGKSTKVRDAHASQGLSASNELAAMSQTKEFIKKQIIEIQKKLKAAKIHGLTDKEAWEIFDETKSLKEMLLKDVKLQDSVDDDDDAPSDVTGLGRVVDEQFKELLMEEFGANTTNFRRTQEEFDLKLSFLVEKNHVALDDKTVIDLIGFVAYKSWGAPQPSVSVGAIGVASKFRGKGKGRDLMRVVEERASLLGVNGPGGFVPGEVRLRALASAVRFYERLGYERILEDSGEMCAQLTPGCPDLDHSNQDGQDTEDMPCVPMFRQCLPSSVSVEAPMSPRSSSHLAPWSPRQARAIEDGPTWPSMKAFISTD